MPTNIWSNLYTAKEQPRDSSRPTVMGRKYAASTGHYLATEESVGILAGDGVVVDAGVAAAMALAVLKPNVVSFPGVAPTLIYLPDEGKVVTLEGLGYWPAAPDVDKLIAEGGDVVPEGVLRTVVPAAPATHM